MDTYTEEKGVDTDQVQGFYYISVEGKTAATFYI
jgi:hypothetical protein